MKRQHRFVACTAWMVATAFLPTAAAQAAIITSVTANSATGVAGITSWPKPFTDSTTGATTPLNNPGQFNSAENNYGGSSLFSIAQSFTATTSGRLTDAQITISGTAPVSFSVNVYDAGTSGWADIGAGTYTPGTNVSTNLLSDTSTQTWAGYTAPGATAAVLDFAFTGADQVSIVAGRQYIVEIASQTNPNGMIWFRLANNALNYPGGQAFRQRSPLNGNAVRDMAMAVSVAPVPEPSTLCCAVVAFSVLSRAFGARSVE